MRKQLQRAISRQQQIRVIYLDRSGRTTMRRLRPLEIAGDRLKAYCFTRRAPRVFLIDNILALQPLADRHAG